MERKRLCTNESKKNDLKEVVIYTKEIKEKKERKVKYLPSLIDDLPGNLCMFYLAFGGVQRIGHKIELSPCSHYIIKS